MQASEPGALAYILQNKVSHARHLPRASSHAFVYPTLCFLLSLSALEANKLDLGHGRLFEFRSAGSRGYARVTGIRPEAYLHDYDLGCTGRSIREKLKDVLRRFGHEGEELEDAWMMTMPSYLGVEGINPLTVFYCYKKTSPQLWLVVLEVHNTFGERHVYVLQTGTKYEDEPNPSFTHSWTFPRQFHVSPFNDRSGFYKCSIIAPSHAPFSPSPTLSQNPPEKEKSSLPMVHIQLYTPEHELKLTATLRTMSASPLTSKNLLSALSRYPLTLLLSFPRIAWQAFHLHYNRRLDVYGRPEPRSVDPALEDTFSEDNKAGEGEGEGGVWTRNEVQRGDGGFGVGGGVGWQPEGVLERFARRIIEAFLEERSSSMGIHVHLLSTNPSYSPKSFPPTTLESPVNSKINNAPTKPDLTITTRSSRAFLLILSSPSAAHALLLGQDADALFTVSSPKLFLQLFSSPISTSTPRRLLLLQRLRKIPVPSTLLPPFSDADSASALSSASELQPRLEVPPAHPLDVPDLFYVVPAFIVLSAFIAVTYFEKAVFSLVGARFVKGTEPWGGWERAEMYYRIQSQKENQASS